LVLGFEATASLFDITLVTVAYLTWSTGGGLLQWFGCNYLSSFASLILRRLVDGVVSTIWVLAGLDRPAVWWVLVHAG
jgi:hypothetical protein